MFPKASNKEQEYLYSLSKHHTLPLPTVTRKMYFMPTRRFADNSILATCRCKERMTGKTTVSLRTNSNECETAVNLFLFTASVSTLVHAPVATKVAKLNKE